MVMDEKIPYEAARATLQGLKGIKLKWPRFYTLLYCHRNTSNEQMIFDDKPWMIPIAKDNSKHIVVTKPSQVGFTEFFIADMFTLARQGFRGIYALPSDTWRATFVGDRIDKLIDRCPEYKAAVRLSDRETDARTFKNIYGTGWKFVGSKSRNNFYEVPCDALLIDEFDLHDQDNLIYAEDRLQKSRQKHTRKFGNPTREGFGIYKEFMKSDQKHWHVPCDKCGHEQVLDWYKHFVKEDRIFGWQLRDSDGNPVCEKCEKPFNRLAKGRWIADNPKSKISGYAISRLFVYVVDTDIQELFDKYVQAVGDPTRMQNFHNNYLGITFENWDEKLTEALLVKAASKDVERLTAVEEGIQTVAGIDQGALFHVVASIIEDGVSHDSFIGTCKTWSELDDILDAMNATTVVVDAQGGGYAETRQFCERRSGAWMCYYVPKDRVKRTYNLEYAEAVVQTNRTEMIDLMVQSFKLGKVKIPLDYKMITDYVKQMLEPTRILDTGGRAIWTKGEDHYFHATVYRHLALLISGIVNSRSVRKSWRRGATPSQGNLVGVGPSKIGSLTKPKIQNDNVVNWRR